jgi:hypothetical protein
MGAELRLSGQKSLPLSLVRKPWKDYSRVLSPCARLFGLSGQTRLSAVVRPAIRPWADRPSGLE